MGIKQQKKLYFITPPYEAMLIVHPKIIMFEVNLSMQNYLNLEKYPRLKQYLNPVNLSLQKYPKHPRQKQYLSPEKQPGLKKYLNHILY